MILKRSFVFGVCLWVLLSSVNAQPIITPGRIGGGGTNSAAGTLINGAQVTNLVDYASLTVTNTNGASFYYTNNSMFVLGKPNMGSTLNGIQFSGTNGDGSGISYHIGIATQAGTGAKKAGDLVFDASEANGHGGGPTETNGNMIFNLNNDGAAEDGSFIFNLNGNIGNGNFIIDDSVGGANGIFIGKQAGGNTYIGNQLTVSNQATFLGNIVLSTSKLISSTTPGIPVGFADLITTPGISNATTAFSIYAPTTVYSNSTFNGTMTGNAGSLTNYHVGDTPITNDFAFAATFSQTNRSQKPIRLEGSIGCEGAVGGVGQINLVVKQTTGATNVFPLGATASVVESNVFSFNKTIMPGAGYYFTNVSSGAGAGAIFIVGTCNVFTNGF